VTEKVYTALRAGAVPIYQGAPEVRMHVPGPRAVIYADDYDGPEALGRHLQRLLKAEAAYAKYFEWDLAEFAQRETVAQCPWQCRACELVAERRVRGRADASSERRRPSSETE